MERDEREIARLALTTTEAAAAIGVPERSLQTWRWRGGGPPFFKLGTGGKTSPVRYRVEAIQEYMRQRERASTSANAPPPEAS